MYRVYLDGTLLDEKDVIGLAEGAEFTISREFGIGNSEQILRDKAEFQLKFSGQAYSMICTKRKENYCTDFAIRIDYFCAPIWETIFTGIIQQKNIELSVFKCVANVTAIRDNSFSGLVRDYLNTDIGLYNTKTINCEDLELISQTYTMFDDPADLTSTKTITAFDVLDVLQYYLNYITNNQIEIRSNYLTGAELGAVRFAITTGYNMHNTTGTLEQTTPMLSFQKVFDELRKKLKVYMGIEYDGDTPYLRIEKESYFFDATEEILNISEPPAEVVEKLDTSLLYNQINVGSSTTELQNDAVPDYPQEKLIAWNEENYTNCGGCGGEKDSTLDLVSDFIIDSNLIYEALQEVAGSDYANDDAVFMFHYYIDTDERIALVTNDDVYGKDIYNEEITNEEVLTKWSATSCAATYRSAVNAFNVSQTYVNGQLISSVSTLLRPTFTNLYTQDNFAGNIVFDDKSNLTTAVISGTNPYGLTFPFSGTGNDNTTYFTVPSNGSYKFKANADFFDVGLGGNPPFIFLGGSGASIRFIIKIAVYSDNTFGTLLSEVEADDFTTWTTTSIAERSITLITDDLALASGNTVFVKYMVEYNGTITDDTAFGIGVTNNSFVLLEDDQSCDNIEQSTSALPFVVELKHPICYQEFSQMKENKRGYVTLMDNRYWIREVKYRPGKLSDLVLLGSEPICGTS